MARLKILVFHPKEWVGSSNENVEVRHVSIGGSIPRRLNGTPSEDGIGEVADSEGIRNFMDAVEQFRPDIFLFGIHFQFMPSYVARARAMCPEMKVVMHYTDQRKDVHDDVGKYLGLIDLLLVTNQDEADHQKYRDFGFPKVATLYDGINPNKYYPMPVEIKHDVFFGGNNHYGLYESIKKSGQKPPEVLNFSKGKFRHDFLMEVNSQFDLLVRGRLGWDEQVFYVKPMRFHPRYLSAIREAKIVIGTAVAPRYKLYMRRMWRGIASARMLLMEYVPGMEEDFENHEHMVWFRTIEEGIDLIRYYLNNDDERERIAKSGYQLILDNHTCDHRLDEFEQIVRRVF